VLLLSSGRRRRSGLHLGMLLGHQGRMLLLGLVWMVLSLVVLLLLLLMLQPGGISRILMLMGENVLGLRL
jgi:hypothetical protein